MVKSLHIDGFGRKKDRQGVALIQRLQGSAARKAAAQAKRDRRSAKRAQETSTPQGE